MGIRIGETKGIIRLTMKNPKALQYKSPQSNQSRLENLQKTSSLEEIKKMEEIDYMMNPTA